MHRARRAAILAALALTALPAAPARAQDKLPCADCVRVTLEAPRVVRGPGREIDAPFSLRRLKDGRFRGFTSNHDTFAVDGKTPFDMGGDKRVVLPAGEPGSPAECGRWITSVIPAGAPGALIGLVHEEAACNHRDGGQAHKSMAIATSRDEGETWRMLGSVLAGDEGPVVGRPSGLGDCTAIDGDDGYLYAYCLRARDWKNVVARAPKSAFGPGDWRLWDGAAWASPGRGGAAAPLGQFVGQSAAYWPAQKLTLLVAADHSLRLSLSADKRNFARVSAPLVRYEADEWRRPAPSDLYAYASLLGTGGGNWIGEKFLLAYMYVPPAEGFASRYLVMQEGRITMNKAAPAPQVRTALARYTRHGGRRWSTSGPAIDRGGYTFDRTLGYLLTAPAVGSVQLDECVRPLPGGAEHRLARAGACGEDGFRRRRTAGFAFAAPGAGRVPLYSCYSEGRRFAFASLDAACEGQGEQRLRLGFILEHGHE